MTSYVPAGTSVNLKNPLVSVLTAALAAPVFNAFKLTWTPATGAPALSVTMPVIDPPGACAITETELRSRQTSSTGSAERIRIDIESVTRIENWVDQRQNK